MTHRNTQILSSVTDSQWAVIIGQPRINRAAQRRQDAAFRAAIVSALGREPEASNRDSDRYCATTGELIQTLCERGLFCKV